MANKKQAPMLDRDALIKAVEEFDFEKKVNKKDLSSDQDLSIAIMNLISIEEHFVFSGAKTNNNNYYDLVADIREMRKNLMQLLIKEYDGEVWCISKHLLAASMRLIEVGTKQLGMGNKKQAYDLFDKGYELYSLFWGLNMKIVGIGDVKKIPDDAIDKNDKNEKKSILKKLGGLVKKAVDCCIE